LIDHHFEEEIDNSIIDIFSGYRYFKFKFVDYNNNPFSFAIYFIEDMYEFGIEVDIDLSVGNDGKRHYIIRNEMFCFRKLDSNQSITLYSRSKNKVNSEILKEVFPKIVDISDEKLYLFYLYDNFVNKTLKNTPLFDIIGRFYSQVLSIEYLNSYNLTLFNKTDLAEYYENDDYNQAICQF